jgi:hypothetical protein
VSRRASRLRPRRIFTDTGGRPPGDGGTIRTARSGSSSSVAPAPVFVTFARAAEADVDDVRLRASTARAASAISAAWREDLHGQRMLVGRDP